MKILDIGCGPTKYKSLGDTVVGLDIQKFPSVDVVHNLEKAPLPFEDKNFDMVYSSHTIEHMHNLLQLMNEVKRVLKPGGTFKIIVPHRSNPFASYFGHYTYWNSLSFDCLYDPENDLKGFELLSKRIMLVKPFRWLEPLVNRIQNFYEWRLSLFIPATEVEFILRKKTRTK